MVSSRKTSQRRLKSPRYVSCSLNIVTELIFQSVVLQNLSHGFTHPSILDAKLGTVLHEPDAPKEKQERMEKNARETTTKETGLRLTGCQVSCHCPSVLELC